MLNNETRKDNAPVDEHPRKRRMLLWEDSSRQLLLAVTGRGS